MIDADPAPLATVLALHIGKLCLEPNDILVVQVPATTTPEAVAQIHRVAEHLVGRFGNKVLVKFPEIEFSTISPGAVSIREVEGSTVTEDAA